MIDRGSEWKRWEPHIHAPGTVLNNQFGGDSRFGVSLHAVGRWGGDNDDNLDVCGGAESQVARRRLSESIDKDLTSDTLLAAAGRYSCIKPSNQGKATLNCAAFIGSRATCTGTSFSPSFFAAVSRRCPMMITP